MIVIKKTLRKPLCFTVIATLCLFTVTFFAATGCEKHGNSSEDELYFYVRVENAEKYSNVVAVKLMMRDGVIFEDVELARGDWKDGCFKIALPKIDKKNYRRFVNQRMLPITIIENLTTINISNKNARSGIAEFFGVDKNGNVVTRFHPAKIDEDDNVARIDFKYVNSDVSIFGYIEAGTWATDFDENNGFTSNWTWKNHTIYSVEYKEGWNVSSDSSFQSPEGTIINKYSTIPINSNLKWYGGESWEELD